MDRITLYVDVEGLVARNRNQDQTIVCKNEKYQIYFTFDRAWNAYTKKTARFIWNGEYQDVEFTGNVCPAPEIQSAPYVTVGVFVEDVIRTSTGARIPCQPSILCVNSKPSAGNTGPDGRFGIIDVTELPTKNIRENAVYRLTRAGGVDLWIVDGDEAISLAWIAAAEGITIIYHVVDTLPDVLEKSYEASLVLHAYILKDTGVAYWDEGNGAEMVSNESDFKGWATPEEIEARDKTDESKYGFYAVKNASTEELYMYKNGAWVLLGGIIDVEGLPTADINKNAIYRKPVVGAEVYIVSDNILTESHTIKLADLYILFGLSTRVHHLVVDELPSIPLHQTDTDVFIYVDASTGKAFVPDNENTAFSEFSFGDLAGSRWIDHIPTIADGEGIYTYKKTEYEYYTFADGVLEKLFLAKDKAVAKAEVLAFTDGLLSRKLESIVLDESYDSVGAYAFAGCTNLKTVTLGKNVSTIGSNAFYNCTSLTSVRIEREADWVDNNMWHMWINNDAFLGCPALTDVYVSWPNPDIGDSSIIASAPDLSQCLPASVKIHYAGEEGGQK